jgi:hypothetical protein
MVVTALDHLVFTARDVSATCDPDGNLVELASAQSVK